MLRIRAVFATQRQRTIRTLKKRRERENVGRGPCFASRMALRGIELVFEIHRETPIGREHRDALIR